MMIHAREEEIHIIMQLPFTAECLELDPLVVPDTTLSCVDETVGIFHGMNIKSQTLPELKKTMEELLFFCVPRYNAITISNQAVKQ